MVFPIGRRLVIAANSKSVGEIILYGKLKGVGSLVVKVKNRSQHQRIKGNWVSKKLHEIKDTNFLPKVTFSYLHSIKPMDEFRGIFLGGFLKGRFANIIYLIKISSWLVRIDWSAAQGKKEQIFWASLGMRTGPRKACITKPWENGRITWLWSRLVMFGFGAIHWLLSTMGSGAEATIWGWEGLAIIVETSEKVLVNKICE